MNLAIDIGNTSIKFGVFDGAQPKEVPAEEKTLAEIISANHVSRIIISKSGSDNAIENYIRQQGIPYLVLSSQLKLPLTIKYKTPTSLGADRIAGSVAAMGLFPASNVLKIDFGTCITYDIITDKAEYLGGAISPGMMMRFHALNHYTAALPFVEPEGNEPVALLGTDTSTSILSGVVQGIAHEVDGIIKDYNERFSGLKVVVTGGDRAFFGALLKSEIFARPYLVLEGLNTILNYNA